MAMGQDGVEGKCMIDLVSIKKDMLHYVQNVKEEEWDKAFQITMMYYVKSGWWGYELRGER